MKGEDTIVVSPGDIEQVTMTDAEAVPVNPSPSDQKASKVSGIRILEYVMAATVVVAVLGGLVASLRGDDSGGGNAGVIVDQEAFANFAPDAPDAACPFDDAILDVKGDGSLLMRQIVNEDTVTVQLAYDDEGWVGFAFSDSGSMVPNVAVIGLPDDGTVLKYNLGGKSVSAVTPLAQGSQTLTDASIIQQDGQTVLTFTKPRFESGEVGVSLGRTQLLWALGGGNNLARHAERGSAFFDFTSCVGEVVDDGEIVAEEPFSFAPDATLEDCPFDNTIVDIRQDGSLLMRHVVNEEDGTATFQVEYDGEAWIGISLTDSTSMVPNTAIIGLPNEGTVRKYNLGGKSVGAVVELNNELQTLQDTSILQQDGRTVMTFTTLLREADELVLSTGQTNFLWAVGPGNDLAQHEFRGSSTTILVGCPAKLVQNAAAPVNKATIAPTTSPIAVATQTPTVSPTKAPTTASPTQSPTKSPVTEAPTKTAVLYVDFPDQEQAYSKMGNRRSCNFNSCPSGPWAAPTNLGAGCQCTNNLNSCYWEGQPTTIEYYPQIELAPTQWTGVYKLQGSGSRFGRGGDTASGVDCFEDPLKGGFKVDLLNTGYAFDRRSWVRMSGASPSIKIRADSAIYEDRSYGASDAQLQWSIPAGTQSLEVVCGGWPAECWSDLYVYAI